LKENKIVWLTFQNTSDEEMEKFIKELDKIDLPYKLIAMNKPLYFLSYNQIKKVIKLLESVLKIESESKK